MKEENEPDQMRKRMAHWGFGQEDEAHDQQDTDEKAGHKEDDVVWTKEIKRETRIREAGGISFNWELNRNKRENKEREREKEREKEREGEPESSSQQSSREARKKKERKPVRAERSESQRGGRYLVQLWATSNQTKQKGRKKLTTGREREKEEPRDIESKWNAKEARHKEEDKVEEEGKSKESERRAASRSIASQRTNKREKAEEANNARNQKEEVRESTCTAQLFTSKSQPQTNKQGHTWRGRVCDGRS